VLKIYTKWVKDNYTSKNEVLKSYIQNLKAKHKHTQHSILVFIKFIISLEYY